MTDQPDRRKLSVMVSDEELLAMGEGIERTEAFLADLRRDISTVRQYLESKGGLDAASHEVLTKFIERGDLHRRHITLVRLILSQLADLENPTQHKEDGQ
ncbi:hypothetical protein [Rhodovulum marinum]|uniref:Uncharacterized protein n=1 Tax=Rhodovulum marinum TaxID=320662 RepID=A0A4R2Q3R6_9RHOB|nr:hypothetical protein [Rhodovulum marinum]TCP43362.1 hypothetical protein EV662_102560 [Rhodovulum marinum]